MRYDVVIAGAGLAGACAAFHLSHTMRVLVLERGTPGAGASGAAAGLVNPFPGRKAAPAWRHTEALAALHALLDAAGASAIFHPTGVLRPAADATQARAFAATAASFPVQTAWLSSEAARERWPEVAAGHGALWVRGGGHVPVARLVGVLLGAAERQGAAVQAATGLVGWERQFDLIVAITDAGAVPTHRLLLALGDGFGAFPALAPLLLHRVKGQTIRLGCLPGSATLPALAGGVYVVPESEGLVVGATFEHTFETLAPTESAGAVLRAKAAGLLPALADAPVRDVRAGVRVTRAGSRRPLVGPLPGQPGVWVFTGLGSKGLLTAPLLACDLPAFLADPTLIPLEVRPRAG